MAGRRTRWSLTDSPRIIIVSTRSTMRVCLFLFHGQIKDQSPEPAFCDFILVCTHGGLVLQLPSLYVLLLKGIHNARRNVTTFQTQKISGTSRHPSTTVSRRDFSTLACRRKCSLKAAILLFHALPCPWILSPYPRSCGTARLGRRGRLNYYFNDYFDIDVSQVICCTRFFASFDQEHYFLQLRYHFKKALRSSLKTRLRRHEARRLMVYMKSNLGLQLQWV